MEVGEKDGLLRRLCWNDSQPRKGIENNFKSYTITSRSHVGGTAGIPRENKN